MGADRRRRWNTCRRAFLRGYDEGPRAGQRRNARASDRQGLFAWTDVPGEPDSHVGFPLQGADVSLLRRHELRNPAPVSGPIAQPEVRETLDGTHEQYSMMQSSPLNFRRVIIWIGRLVLGGIFIYAGYSKIFFPNTNLWPFFILKFSVSMNLSNFATQVEAFKMLPPWGVQFVAHSLPFTEVILGLLLLIGWRLRIWASLLTFIMLG